MQHKDQILRDKRRANGICIRCGKVKVAKFDTCQICRASRMVYYRKTGK